MAKGFLYDNGDELITRESIPSPIPYISSNSVGKVLRVTTNDEDARVLEWGTSPFPLVAQLLDRTSGGDPVKIFAISKIAEGTNVSSPLSKSELIDILERYKIVTVEFLAGHGFISLNYDHSATTIDITFSFIDSDNNSIVYCDKTVTVSNTSANAEWNITNDIVTVPLSGGSGGSGLYRINASRSGRSFVLDKTWTEINTAFASTSCVLCESASEDVSNQYFVSSVGSVEVDQDTIYFVEAFSASMGELTFHKFTASTTSSYPTESLD